MPRPVFLGEFEQLVMIAILHLDNDAPVLAVRDKMEEISGRAISRTALYRTLERITEKDWVDWTVDDEERPERGGHPRRRFRITKQGVALLSASRKTLLTLWAGVEGRLR
jgi:DNA-binding PadR family transcriptional regulator